MSQISQNHLFSVNAADVANTADADQHSAGALEIARTSPGVRSTSGASKGQMWTGRVLTGLAVLFLLFDGFGKVARIAPVVEGSMQLGYPESSVALIGWVVLACTALYVIPRTASLGAILLTGFLGGAVATHVRVSNPLLSHTLFPVYLGIIVWAGLVLRRPNLRVLLGLSNPSMR